MRSYRSKLTGACYGNGHGIGGWEGIVLVVGMVWQGHGDLVVIILQKLADPTFQ